MNREVRKPQLKREQQLKNLNNKSWRIICDRFREMRTATDVNQCENEAPEVLNNLLSPINSKITNVKQRLKDGNFNLKSVVETLSDSSLQDVQSLFPYDPENKSINQQKAISEDQIVKLSYLLVSEMELLDRCVEHCRVAIKSNLLRTFVECFGAQYNIQRGEELGFNIKSFAKDVDGIVKFRKLLREAMEARDRQGQEHLADSNEGNSA